MSSSGHRYHIFISYAHKNKNLIFEFYNYLVDHYKSLKIWIDQDGIRNADNWKLKITEGILSSQIILCFISKHYINSEMCLFEVEKANLKNKTYFTIFIEDVSEMIEEMMNAWKENINNNYILYNAYIDNGRQHCLIYKNPKDNLWSGRVFEVLLQDISRELDVPLTLEIGNKKNKSENASKTLKQKNYEETESTAIEFGAFLSYSWSNDKQVKNIRDRLNEKGIKFWWDKDHMINGQSKEQMAKGINNSAIFICCLSKEYNASPNCRLELNFADAKAKRIIYVICDKSKMDYKIMLDSFSAQIQMIVGNQIVYRHDDLDPFMNAVEKYLEEMQIPLADKYALKSTTQKIENSLIKNYLPPKTDKNFIRRESLFAEIAKELEVNKKCILTGLSGIGKSTYAYLYAKSKRDEKIVRWINAETSLKIDTDIHQIANELHIKTENRQFGDVIGDIFGKLKDENVLFILNNVENFQDIKTFTENLGENIEILMTSRNMNPVDDARIIIIEPFDELEAKTYIQKNLKFKEKVNEDDVNRLLEYFSDTQSILPKDLEMTVSYLNENKTYEIADFLKSSKVVDEVTNGIFEQLKETSPVTWSILQYTSVLNPDFISIELIDKLSQINDNEKLQEHLYELSKYSLIQIVLNFENEIGVIVHSTVQKKVKHYLEVINQIIENNYEIYEKLLVALNEIFPKVDQHQDEKWRQASKQIQNMEIFLKNFDDKIKEKTLLTAELMDKLVQYHKIVSHESFKRMVYFESSLKIKKKLSESENSKRDAQKTFDSTVEKTKILEYSLKIYEIEISLYKDRNHPSVAACLNTIGSAYKSLGKSKETLEYYIKSYEIYSKLYKDMDHPEVPLVLNNIGLAYTSLGKTQKALENYLKSYEMVQRLYKDQDQPDVAALFYNIGLAYESLGNPIKEPLEYYLKSFEMYSRLYKDQNHPDVAQLLNKIGEAYDSLGDTNKALDYYLQSQKMRSSLHKDNDNPAMATLLNKIGNVYYSLKKSKDALEYHLKSYKIRIRLFDSNDNSDVAESLNNIGDAYKSLGDIINALDFYTKSFEIYSRLYKDQDHLDVARCLNNFGDAYYSLDDIAKSLEYHLKCYEMRRRLYKDVDHEELAKSLNSIGEAYDYLGDTKRALDNYLKSYEMRKRLYKDKDHSDVAASLNNIGSVYNSLEETKKSLDYLVKSYEMYLRLYKDEDHDFIATLLNDIGMIYVSLGETRKALDFYLKSYDMRSRLYKDDDHPEVARCLNNMGSVYDSLGETAKALECYLKFYEMISRLNNNDDQPSVVRCLNIIGTEYHSLGKAEKALEYFRKSYEMIIRLFEDNDHPDLALALNNIGMAYSSLGDPSKALEYYLKSYNIYERLFKNDHPHLALSLNNIGNAYYSLDDIAKALEFYIKCYEMRIRLYKGKDHADVAESLYNIGHAYESLEDTVNAINNYSKCYEMFSKSCYENHPSVILALDSIRRLLMQ